MNEISIYQTESGTVEVRLEQDTVWLRQEQMSQLFGRERSVITKHLRNVFAEGELKAEAVCAKFAHTASDDNYQGFLSSLSGWQAAGTAQAVILDNPYHIRLFWQVVA